MARHDTGHLPEPGLVPWRGAGCILVVDDEESVRVLAARVLEASGFEVVDARDGVEAIEVFSRAPESIRLVLLDWKMPRLGGGETLDALRLLRDDLPVILSSGYAEQTVSSRLDDRLTAFIQKPYRPQELIAKVRAALG
jgi:CheY-like chemotaxis protein